MEKLKRRRSRSHGWGSEEKRKGKKRGLRIVLPLASSMGVGLPIVWGAGARGSGIISAIISFTVAGRGSVRGPERDRRVPCALQCASSLALGFAPASSLCCCWSRDRSCLASLAVAFLSCRLLRASGSVSRVCRPWKLCPPPLGLRRRHRAISDPMHSTSRRRV